MWRDDETNPLGTDVGHCNLDPAIREVLRAIVVA
jgi:hypothetical protein